jgi:hypothetical protein
MTPCVPSSPAAFGFIEMTVFRSGTMSVTRAIADIELQLDGWFRAGLVSRSQLSKE